MSGVRLCCRKPSGPVGPQDEPGSASFHLCTLWAAPGGMRWLGACGRALQEAAGGFLAWTVCRCISCLSVSPTLPRGSGVILPCLLCSKFNCCSPFLLKKISKNC